MLRDAALLQLDLSRAALAEGVLTKDATSYNVQFDGSRPVFIDLGSFERLVPGEPWAGYRQFCELFLNPLYLQAVADVPFQPWLRGSLNGISPTDRRRRPSGSASGSAATSSRTCDSTPGPSRATPTPTAERDVRGELKRAGFGPKIIDAQMANLQRGRRAARVEGASASTWSSYGARGHYTDARPRPPRPSSWPGPPAPSTRPMVLDLGANDGRFSRVAVDAGASLAVAVDGDHLVVDHLYRAAPGGGRAADPPAGARPRRPVAGAGLALAGAALLRRPRAPRPRAVPGGDPPPGAHEHGALRRDRGASCATSTPRSWSRCRTATTRWPPACSARKRDGLFDHYDRPQWEEALAAALHGRRAGHPALRAPARSTAAVPSDPGRRSSRC